MTELFFMTKVVFIAGKYANVVVIDGIQVIDMDENHIDSKPVHALCEASSDISYWGYGWEERQGEYCVREVAACAKERGFTTMFVEYLS